MNYEEAAIRAHDVSKKYRINEQRFDALRDLLVSKLTRSSRRSKGSIDPKASIWALKNLTFEIKRGEVVGIIGANGAGKSTLLKILSRITKPTTGSVEIFGRVGTLLEVGTAFHPELTGRENVFLNGAVLGMTKKEIAAKFDDIVGFAETEAFVDTPVKYYSTGMHVRLAFAVAAHLETEIMLVDEVLSVGDYKFQKKCLEKIREVSTTGETVIMVSHNLAAIRSLCTRAIWLDNGEQVMSASADECVARYIETNSAQLTSREIDVSRFDRPVGQGSLLRFSRIRVGGRANSEPITYGEPLHVDLEFETTELLEDVAIGVSIHAGDGTWVLEALNTHTGEPYARIAPGRYLVTMTVDRNLLNPGTYVLGAGARSRIQSLDWVREVVTFEVLEKGTRDEWLAPSSGHVRIPTRFSAPSRLGAAAVSSSTESTEARTPVADR